MTAREKRSYEVLGFGSTHDALDAEAVLKGAGVDAVPVPAPRALGSLCGIGLRLEPSRVERAEKLLEHAGIAATGRATIIDV